jgi:hypothetical protein
MEVVLLFLFGEEKYSTMMNFMHLRIISINSANKKTQCLIRKRQVRGLRSQKKRSLLFVNEHFSDKCNEEIGVFLPTLNKPEAFQILKCLQIRLVSI